MKKYLLPSLKLTLALLIICSMLYPLFIAAVGKLTPGGGDGETVKLNGKVVGYALVVRSLQTINISRAVLQQLIIMLQVLPVLIKDQLIPII